MYIVTFHKDFLKNNSILSGEMEWRIFETDNECDAIDTAKRLNAECLININVERFRVWRSETNKFNKKKSKLIY